MLTCRSPTRQSRRPTPSVSLLPWGVGFFVRIPTAPPHPPLHFNQHPNHHRTNTAQKKMPNSTISDSVSELVGQNPTNWVEVAKSFGVPTVAMGVLMWFAWATIDWERKLMLPAIERNNILVERNTDVMEVVIRRLDVQMAEPKSN